MSSVRDYGFGEVSELLAGRMEQLCAALGLRGPTQGHVMTPLNPTRADRNPGSFVIQMSGGRAGRWSEFATDQHGDALDLVSLVLFGSPDDRSAKREGFRWAKRFLGLAETDHMTGGTPRLDRSRAIAEDTKRKAEAEIAGALAKKRRSAMSMWLQAKKLAPPAEGEKPSPAWRYFTEARELPLDQLERLPSAVKWTPAANHVESGRTVPAIVSGMFLPAGELVAVHRIFLEPDGLAKIAEPPPKKIWPGGFAGASIPISRGRSGLPIAAAFDNGCVDEIFYCEGVEDGFTAALLAPEWRVLVVGAAANFSDQQPPDCAGAVIVGRDNDTDPKARKAVAARVALLAATCRARGLGFYETRAGAGAKDFNDMVRAIG